MKIKKTKIYRKIGEMNEFDIDYIKNSWSIRINPLKYNPGDKVLQWGRGFDYQYTTIGVVDKVYRINGDEYVDWHNKYLRFCSVYFDNLIRPEEIKHIGFQRVTRYE